MAACGGATTRNLACNLPEREKVQRGRVLDAGAALMQEKPPIGALNSYLDGFHFFSGNMKGQMEAHHYCASLNEELIQCVIYDGNKAGARLMGVGIHRQRTTVRQAAAIREGYVALARARGENPASSSRPVFQRRPNRAHGKTGPHLR
jgi:hypothetical protein